MNLVLACSTAQNSERRAANFADGRTKNAGTFFSSSICFRHVLLRLISQMKDGRRHLLNIVMETGHRNANDAARIFDETKEEALAEGITLLGEIELAPKHQRLALMGADYLAYLTYSQEREWANGMPRQQASDDETILQTQNISLIEGGLELHHQQLEKIQKRRRARRKRNKPT